MNRASPAPTTTQRLLDMVERVGNRVPHAALIFLTLIRRRALSIGLASNLWFSLASVAFLTVVIGVISERVIELRLGPYQPILSGGQPSVDEETSREDGGFSADESRGLRYALFALVGALVLFVRSQFVAYFSYSNMGTMLAVSLANILREGMPAPSCCSYSPSNMITRVMSAFALILTFFQKYDRNAGTGTLIALMLPYCVWILVMWTLLFSAWFVLGFPWGL